MRVVVRRKWCGVLSYILIIPVTWQIQQQSDDLKKPLKVGKLTFKNLVLNEVCFKYLTICEKSYIILGLTYRSQFVGGVLTFVQNQCMPNFCNTRWQLFENGSGPVHWRGRCRWRRGAERVFPASCPWGFWSKGIIAMPNQDFRRCDCSQMSSLFIFD